MKGNEELIKKLDALLADELTSFGKSQVER